MTRTWIAALLAVCGMVAPASGQTWTSFYSPAYTTYYHAPAYSSYSYSGNYGPLGLVNWGAWRPAWSSAYYTSPYSTYTAAYSPLVSTSYYALASASACCDPCSACNPCCTPCCASCSSGGCPGGNCGLNYGPVTMEPMPDPNASGSSGQRTFESESNGETNGTDDGFRRSSPGSEYDATERGAGYRPPERIEQRAPTGDPEALEEPEAGDTEPGLSTPDEPAAEALLNLDSRLTAAPSLLLRERTPMRARFGSPKLARATVDPSRLPGSPGLQLVQK